MKPNDLLKQISVKIEAPSQGSGVIYFPQGQKDKVYILTAKHCLYDNKSKEIFPQEDITISYFNPVQEVYVDYTLNENDRVLAFDDDYDIDLAILCIAKSSLQTSFTPEVSIKLLENEQDFEKAFVWGFPNSKDEERLLRNINVDILYSDKPNICELQSYLTTDGFSMKSTITGMSGGAVIINEEKKVFLLGICTDFEEWYRFQGVSVTAINLLLEEFELQKETLLTVETDNSILKDTSNVSGEGKKNTAAKNEEQEASSLAPYKIINQFKIASNDLATHRNYFQNLPNSNIPRKEVEELYDWIQDENTKQKIGMLTGDAGSGKSVILRDLFFKVGKDNTAILGIKSDKNYAGTPKKLRQKTGLTEDIKKMVLKLSEEGRKTVILIDQIDALSLSHSVNKKYLKTVKVLVHSLKGVPSVKIILSVRKWDLAYNPELNIVDVDGSGNNYKVQKEFSVSLLNGTQVESILKQLEINLHTFPKSLLELLKTPLHLDIFTGIYSSEFDLKSLRNLHDLYSALWKEKVHNLPSKKKIKPEKCTKLLSAIAQETSVSTSEIKYRTKFSKELEYLKSSGLLIGNDKTIQFFHQSFHDFVFAKQFVERGMSIYDFLIENCQSIKIRVKLKMIINYLRDYDEGKYLLVMQKLINSDKIDFHIKSLLINLLGYRNNPSQAEETLAFNSILSKDKLARPFLEAAEGDGWLSFFITKKVMDNLFFLKPNKSEAEKDFIARENKSRFFASNLLSRKLPSEMRMVLEYIQSLEDYDNKQANVLRILSNVSDWSSALARKIYEKYKPAVDDNNTDYWNKRILGDAVKSNSTWALNMYKPHLHKLSENSKTKHDFKFNYDDIKLAELLFKANPEQSFLLYFEMIEKLCSNSIYGDYPLNPSYIFDTYSYDLTKKGQRDKHNFKLIDLMIEALKNMAQSNNPIFKQFIKEHKNSSYTTVLHILVYAFISNPELYSNDIFDLIISLNNKNALSENSSFALSLRQLIKKSYSYFNEKQKKQVNQALLSVRSPHEAYRYHNKENKLVFPGNVGVLKLRYLMAIPEIERRKFPIANRHYHELKRKHKDLEEKSRGNSFRMGPVPAPYPARAYNYLTIKKWQESFEKYDSNYVRDIFNDTGSRESHANHFKKQITKRPNYFIEYIQELMKDDRIYYRYKLAAMEGLFDAEFDIEICASVYEMLIEVSEMEKYVYDLIRLTENFIQKKKITKNIVNYLIFQALNNSDPTEDTILANKENNETHGVNVSTNRGLAAGKLTRINFDERFKQEIFLTLNDIIAKDFIEVLVPILVNLKWHLANDREQVLKFFLNIVARSPKNKTLLFNALECSRYLSQSHFSEIKGYLAEAAKVEVCQESISIILAWARNREEKEAVEMHDNLCENSENARAILAAIASHGLEEDSSNELMKYFFTRGFSDTSIEVMEEYSRAFGNFSVDIFPAIYPLLKQYSKSIAAEMNLSTYYDYLQKCSDRYPKKCLKLMKNFKNNLREDIGNSHFRLDEPLSVVLGALNSLEASSDKNTKSIELGMKLFNRLSQYPNMSNYAQKALLESEK